MKTTKLLLSLSLMLTVGATGCSIFTKKGSSRGGSSKKSAFTGTFEFVNKSGQDVCGIELRTGDRAQKGFVHHKARLANGATVKLTTQLPTRQLAVAACDGQGLLVFKSVKLKEPALTLYASRSAANGAKGQVVTVNWKKTWTSSSPTPAATLASAGASRTSRSWRRRPSRRRRPRPPLRAAGKTSPWPPWWRASTATAASRPTSATCTPTGTAACRRTGSRRTARP